MKRGISPLHKVTFRSLDGKCYKPDGGFEGVMLDAECDWSAMMARAQGGDRMAYSALLRNCTPYIRQIARRRISNPADVEDVVQDVLMAIHMARATYDPSRPFAPWLATIADRRVLDALRRLSRRSRREEAIRPDHESSHVEEAVTYPDGLLQRDIGRAIRDLPEGQKRAIELVNVRGLELADAARESGQSVGAIKVAVHRALKELRARFEAAGK